MKNLEYMFSYLKTPIFSKIYDQAPFQFLLKLIHDCLSRNLPYEIEGALFTFGPTL
jgi:hypothetical protein